jgi:hypothetical protein
MADQPLFNLDAEARWRLAYDKQQWVLQKAKKRRTPRRPKPPSSPFEGAPSVVMDWRGVAFVGSELRVLRRVLREAGLVLTPEAQVRLDALPGNFLDFIAIPARFAEQPMAEAA